MDSAAVERHMDVERARAIDLKRLADIRDVHGSVVLLAACAFFAGLHTGCIAMLVLAFLVSPFGLPAIGLWLLDRLYGAKYALQDFMVS